MFAAFESASAAVQAVVDFQRALAVERWPPGIAMRDRVGIHSGEVSDRDGNLFGPAVGRTARVRGLAAGGQVLLSSAAYELVREVLPGIGFRDLGEHRMKDVPRPERVWQVVADGLADGFPALPGGAGAALPPQPTSFVGREREVGEVAALLERHRLVSIVAVGGMGKTRLAIETARAIASDTADGVVFVDLSGVEDAASVPAAVGAAIGVADAQSLPALLAWLRDRRVLLVLDNLEHLLPAVAQTVGRIAEAGDGIRVLATTRHPVRVRLEHRYVLDPLPRPEVPEVRASVLVADLERLRTNPAVALFVQRATAARADFVLTAGNAAAVAAICARLDGIPLAIELAAARLRALSPGALLRRLDHALAVLTGGSADAPGRHRTLRSAIAWSMDALPEGLRTLIVRLTVFQAPFTIDAAAAVAGADEEAMLDAIAELVDRSLVQLLPTARRGRDRYALLLPVREYAAEAAAERGGDLAAVRDLHLGHFRAGVARRPAIVAEDRADVLAAVRWAHERGRADDEVALICGAAVGLHALGRSDEARDLVMHALAHRTEVGREQQARLAEAYGAVLSHGFGRFAAGGV